MQADATANTAHVETLTQLNQDYIDSVSKSDVRRFEQILSNDFLNTNADGTLVNRAQFIAQIARPMTVSDFQCDDVLIRVMGNFAQANHVAVFPCLIDGAGELVVSLQFVGLVRKTIRMVKANELFPERFEFRLVVAAQGYATGRGRLGLLIVSVGLRLGRGATAAAQA